MKKSSTVYVRMDVHKESIDITLAEADGEVRRSGDHVKTDRRDSERLARLARSAELEPVHVPDVVDEAIRDLVRSREDALISQLRARQQLKALLLSNEIRYVGKSSWTAAHRRWLSDLKMPHPAQQIGFEE